MAREQDVDVARLCRVMQSHRLKMQVYREERTAAIRKYAGNHFSSNGSKKKIIVNLLSQYVKVMAPKLVSKNPQFLLSTPNKSMKPKVAAMETWMNRQSEKMYLADTLQRAVIDGLFSAGVVKVALAAPADAANGSWAYRAGIPFAVRVDLDDMIVDMRAKDFHECSYIGHRFRAPLAAIQSDRNYSKYRKDLIASQENPYNAGGDERVHKIGEGWNGEDEDFEDMVDLWEVYLPRHRLVLTLVDDGNMPMTLGHKTDLDGALRVQKWIGPECGPYHFCCFGFVPGNLWPKAPIMDLIDQFDAVNENYRKLVRQAQRQKQVLGVGQGATEDGRRLASTPDGDVVQVNNPDAIKMFNFGGPDQQNMGFAIHMKDVFSSQGGNVNLIGGLEPQSRTAKQDAMLQENSSGTLADMSEISTKFISSVGSGLGWYWYHDPQTVMKTEHSLEGMKEFSVQRQVTPEDRQKIPYDELDLRVDPYSLVHQSPGQKLAAINQVMTQIVMPLAPALSGQGITPDLNAYLKTTSKLADLPELMDIITINEPVLDSQTGGGSRDSRMPATTQRNYTRENVPAQSQDRGMEVMSQAQPASVEAA